MANNFADAQVAISNNSLTDIYTASNKSMVIDGLLTNTGATSINVTMKKYDASGTADFVLYNNMPLPSGSSLKINKVVLQTSDKIKSQSDNSSGNLTCTLQLLTDVT